MIKLCPFCNTEIESSLVRHIKTKHGEEKLKKTILLEKSKGVTDARIGKKFGISFSYLEKVITLEYGRNVSIIAPKKRITQWEPKKFQPERTTVWSFKSRGKWATHDGRYRGNWSPYIPRNLILRYSQLYDLILDYFSGGGTTAVEAKLLSRNCIARDINPDALKLTKENLDFATPQNSFSGNGHVPSRIKLARGDARELNPIENESVDLICAHPPYAGIINYSANSVKGDLSTLSASDFIEQMKRVAQESFRVLKSGRQCAILIGDARKSKHIVPIGFRTIRAFLDAGFTLRELVIKRQHNCKTTGFWYSNSIKYNFLLLAHEFLPIFEKPRSTKLLAEAQQLAWLPEVFTQTSSTPSSQIDNEAALETTSVWIFPFQKVQEEIRRNLIDRFAKSSGSMIEVEWNQRVIPSNELLSLAYIHCPPNSALTTLELPTYFNDLIQIVSHSKNLLDRDGFCVIEARDFRKNSSLIPMGLLVFEHLENSGLELREIIIVTSKENQCLEKPLDGYLDITHKYLLVYRKP